MFLERGSSVSFFLALSFAHYHHYRAESVMSTVSAAADVLVAV